MTHRYSRLSAAAWLIEGPLADTVGGMVFGTEAEAIAACERLDARWRDEEALKRQGNLFT